jgi:hypothetical protein
MHVPAFTGVPRFKAAWTNPGNPSAAVLVYFLRGDINTFSGNVSIRR